MVRYSSSPLLLPPLLPKPLARRRPPRRPPTSSPLNPLTPRAHLEIPMNEYYEYFGPTYHLDVPQSNAEDMNTREYLEKIKTQVFENLRHTGSAPSVQMTGECSPRRCLRGRASRQPEREEEES